MSEKQFGKIFNTDPINPIKPKENKGMNSERKDENTHENRESSKTVGTNNGNSLKIINEVLVN